LLALHTSTRSSLDFRLASMFLWQPMEIREVGVSKKYVVKLSAAERKVLDKVVSQGKPARWKVQRAQAMLQADAGPHGSAWPDSRIAEAYGMTTRSLESWRKRAVEEGPLSLLERKPEDSTRNRRKLDGGQEARLVTLACSEPPPGHVRWTLRLLAERLVELEIVDSISHEAVRTTLKKTALSRG
jgi:Homeodomain-like domain